MSTKKFPDFKLFSRLKEQNAKARSLEHRSFYPLARGANAIFLSQLIPRSFDDASRTDLLRILGHNAPYIPLCVMEINAPQQTPANYEIGHTLLDTQATSTQPFQNSFGPNGEGWPTNAAPYEEHPQALPVELFELIGSHLPRDSVQSMRLVNREFERKISCLVFKSVVVPFKPKIYGPTFVDIKGKGKQQETISDDEDTIMGRAYLENFYDPNKSHVRDGMRVFEQWGPEIRKFALTFEVAEGRGPSYIELTM